MSNKMQKVRVLHGFVKGPGDYAEIGDIMEMPLHQARADKAAGAVEFVGDEVQDDEPGITKGPGVVETRDPKPTNRDPKVSK